MKTVPISGLAEAIEAELNEYAGAVATDVKAEVKAVANETRADIQNRAAVLFKVHSSKPYAKSWKIKKIEETSAGITITIYSSKYQIAHLLEHGHVLVRHGMAVGRVRAYPHIGPAEEEAERKLGTRIKTAIKGA